MKASFTSLRPLVAFALLSGLVGCLANTLNGGAKDPAAAAAAAAGNGAGGVQFPNNPNVPPFEGLTATAAANKVKRILAAVPLTQAEFNQISQDANALPGLVDTWLGSSAYRQAMTRFFADAFQQSQLEGSQGDALVQNMRESFARTAMQLIDEKRPFTELITTRRYMMTTGLMYAYAVADTSYNDDDGGIQNQWYIDDPNWHFTIEKSRGPIDLADASNPQSPNYMTFYAPLLGTGYYTFSNPQTAADQAVIDACKKIDPFVFYDENIFARIGNGAANVDSLLYGGGFRHFYPKEYQPDTILCVTNSTGPSYFKDSDYTDWRMVTINPATASAPQTKFTNLPAFRAGQTTLNLYTTHAGYLTTPSFLAQWPTNVSNSSRATINQAMIVGLGGAIGEDRITPLAKQPSVDAVHSADAACFNCHQDLDPMRQFYRQSFSLFNGPQKDPNQMNMPAKFAYGGVVADGAGVGDLAKIIAGHPLFALAWAQKVCTWATSSPCLESDPELKRIANAFAANNFQFPALVKDIMLSPLVTYRQATQTTATLGQMSALVRRNQLCDLLEQTTGLGDVCGRDQVQNSSNYDVPSLAQSIPGDQYGRGANNPLYVVQPDAIIRSSLENLCTLVADQMAREGVSVPMAQADPNVAIPALVHDLMGIGPAEDSGPIAILQQHYADVLAAKQPESVAWQSTFTLACVSPFVAATSQ